MQPSMTRRIVPDAPVTDVADYVAMGGGEAVATVRRLGAQEIIARIRAAGLRGRGGAGFPTGLKWQGLAAAEAERKFVVCNAAEGEPGTFKDRWILRMNPYQVLEGLAVAALATGAEQAFIGIKAKFVFEIDRLERAAAELAERGIVGEVPITVVRGPDDYLFGEEKGLLEVIEGRDPLPRLYPPYVQGLFEEPGGAVQPAVVNNVETLANVPLIVTNGADWFRSEGTDDSPGTMVFTIGGDTRRHAVVELALGTPLGALIAEHGGGVAGRRIMMVTNGVSNRPLHSDLLDTPMAYETMRRAGSGLGSGGFTVYDDTACLLQVAAAYSAFSYRGSCGQCPPCKLGTEAITERLVRLAQGAGDLADVEEMAAWTIRITDANRCGLGAGEREFARGILEWFPADIERHLSGEICDVVRPVPTITDWDQQSGRFTYG